MDSAVHDWRYVFSLVWDCLLRFMQITRSKKMTRDDITMPMNGMIIKQPEYDCPTHGTVVSTITFNRADTGTVRRFCIECLFDKMIEIGVCEVTEKKT
jgi:hypothetical protein